MAVKVRGEGTGNKCYSYACHESVLIMEPMSDTARLGPFALFSIFFKLGCTSFGGPVAHIAIFRTIFVERKAWLSDRDYADLVALSQFLPGPASSQVGMGLGLMRGGVAGMAAAWLGFTLPSAILMAAFALGMNELGLLEGASWVAGVKAAVVAVVAQALFGMARSLAPDAPRATLAFGGLAVALLAPVAWAQILAIALAGLIGLAVPTIAGLRDDTASALKIDVPRWLSVTCLVAFFLLLFGLPVLSATAPEGALGLFDAFYRAGALVFGGGHVVLPLLQGELVEPGLVSRDAFLAGYGGAQVVPGPMFSIASHLGAIADIGPGGIPGAVLATIAIFLPGALLIVGGLPFWAGLTGNPRARGAVTAVSAAVVGLLAAALYDPVFIEGIQDAPALVLAAAALIAMTKWKAPVWIVIPAAGLIGALVL